MFCLGWNHQDLGNRENNRYLDTSRYIRLKKINICRSYSLFFLIKIVIQTNSFDINTPTARVDKNYNIYVGTLHRAVLLAKELIFLECCTLYHLGKIIYI